MPYSPSRRPSRCANAQATAVRVLATLLVLGLASCAYGPITDPPCVREPGSAATVTVKRMVTLVGAPATMVLVVENQRVYGLTLGESLTFQLDAGEHRIGYDLGFVRCRQRVFLEPGRQYRIELWPVCRIEPQVLSDVCPTPRAWPAPVRPQPAAGAPFSS